ncbi:MAG: AAA family ATPase [Candidatus Omnitrophota bacterium]
MAFTIAVAGKGGSGKTTIAALLIKTIRDNKLGTCLAIDADPNSNLALNLGLDSTVSIGEIIDSIAKTPKSIPVGMSKNEFIELKVNEALSEGNSFDLLSMGRPEGPGCYCYANNVLRDIVGKIIKQYAFCVIDNEAGMEHLSRRTTREADFFIVVSDPTVVGMRSAARIRSLIDEMDFKFKKIFLFINKAEGNVKLIPEIERVNFDKIYQLPFDEELFDFSIKGKPTPDIKKTNMVFKKIEEFRQEYGFRAN